MLCAEVVSLFCVLLLQVSSPYEVAEFDIIFGEGINALGCIFDVAKEVEVLEARVSEMTCAPHKGVGVTAPHITFLQQTCCCHTE